MMIASRLLRLKLEQGDADIEVRIFAPVRNDVDWSCTFEIDWPDEPLERTAIGVDAIQALLLALQMIGAQVYASDHHASGKLVWLATQEGYGFPVPSNMRDLLVGDDLKYF